MRGERVVVIEFGAGKAIPTIRRLGEDLAERGIATLVRINPDANDADEPVVPIRMDGARGIDADRGGTTRGISGSMSEAVPEQRTLPMFDEAAERLPRVASGS